MCNCRQKILEKFKDTFPDAEFVSGQYELLSGRSYSNYEIRLTGKKGVIKPLLHSYCPHCGQAYETKECAPE